MVEFIRCYLHTMQDGLSYVGLGFCIGLLASIPTLIAAAISRNHKH